MPVTKDSKKTKFMRNDLDAMEVKEIMRKKELGKKTKLPKGIFENTGGSGDSRLKSTSEMVSDMKRKLQLYESKKSNEKSKKK
jgi:hypothetical protein